MSPATASQPDPTSDTRSAAQDIPQHPNRPQEELSSPTPVEMSSLASNAPASDPNSSSSVPTTHGVSAEPERHLIGPSRIDTNTAIDQSLRPPPPPPLSDPQPVTRTFSTAIGPSSESPSVPAKDNDGSGPVLTVNLLLTSGARHPFKLDQKYLAKRNVDIPSNDIFNLSVYKLKELILREWREEWEVKPSSPNYIRLIMLGKLLDDKAPLKGKGRTYRDIRLSLPG